MNKKDMNVNDIVNLGDANGWRDTPQIVKDHDEAVHRGEKHSTWSRNISRCYTEYGCNTCGYRYAVDSGD